MSDRTIKRVKSHRASDDEGINIALFRDGGGRVCGWFIGPLQLKSGRFSVPYLPRSRQVLGSIAIIRAIALAERLQLPLCLVDPDELWDSAWVGVSDPPGAA